MGVVKRRPDPLCRQQGRRDRGGLPHPHVQRDREADEAFERWTQKESNWERMANDLAESFSHVDVADAEPAGKNQTPDIVAKEV